MDMNKFLTAPYREVSTSNRRFEKNEQGAQRMQPLTQVDLTYPRQQFMTVRLVKSVFQRSMEDTASTLPQLVRYLRIFQIGLWTTACQSF